MCLKSVTIHKANLSFYSGENPFPSYFHNENNYQILDHVDSEKFWCGIPNIYWDTKTKKIFHFPESQFRIAREIWGFENFTSLK